MDKGAKAAQLADQIRDYLAAWIRKDFPGCLVSVLHVQLSPNLQQATIWIEVFSGDATRILRDLESHRSEYQKRLYTTLQRFAVPTIRFALDTSHQDEKRITDLLNSDEI